MRGAVIDCPISLSVMSDNPNPVKENRGVLFRNQKGDNERRPDYTGVANVAEKEFKLAAWIRTDRRGVKYLSLSFTPSEDDGTDPMLNSEDSN